MFLPFLERHWDSSQKYNIINNIEFKAKEEGKCKSAKHSGHSELVKYIVG